MFTQGSKRYSGRGELSLEVRRQLFHLFLILLWCVPIAYFPEPLTIGLFVLVVVLNVSVVFRYEPLARLFRPLIESLERSKNLEEPGIQALYANLGIFLSYLLFGELSLVGVVVLAVGDSFSTLVGKLIGERRLFFNASKMWEGSLAFFLSVYVVLVFYLDYHLALLLSVFSSLLEAAKLPLDDNFLLPVAVSSLYYLVW